MSQYSDEEIERIFDMKAKHLIETLSKLKQEWVLVFIAFALIAFAILLLAYATEREQ